MRGLGISGLGLTQRGGGGAIFTPADPQEGMTLLAWHEPSSGNTFTDAGTTEASFRDSVRQINDQSGNGNNLTMSQSARRGRLNGVGGKRGVFLKRRQRTAINDLNAGYYNCGVTTTGDASLTFSLAVDLNNSGNRQYGLSANEGVSGQLLILAIAVDQSTNGADGPNGYDGSGDGSMGIFDGSAWIPVEARGNVQPSGASVFTWVIDANTNTVTCYRNGAQVGTPQSCSPKLLQSAVKYLGRDSGSAVNAYNGAFYGSLLYQGAATAQQVAQHYQYLRGLMFERVMYQVTGETVLEANAGATQAAIETSSYFFTSANDGTTPNRNRVILTWDIVSAAPGTIQHTNLALDDIETDTSDTGVTQVNGLSQKDSQLIVGCNNWNATPYQGYIGVFDIGVTGALSLNQTIDIGERVVEGATFDNQVLNNKFIVYAHDYNGVTLYDDDWTNPVDFPYDDFDWTDPVELNLFQSGMPVVTGGQLVIWHTLHSSNIITGDANYTDEISMPMWIGYAWNGSRFVLHSFLWGEQVPPRLTQGIELAPDGSVIAAERKGTGAGLDQGGVVRCNLSLM